MAGVCLDEALPIDADIRRRVLTIYELTNEFGPAWHNRFQDPVVVFGQGEHRLLVRARSSGLGWGSW